MGLRIIQCGRQTVRVIQPDGQIRQFLLPITVSDLLLLHPHHYVSQAKASRNNHSNSQKKSRGTILPLDTHLESGGIYILLPLPRLFPCSSPPSVSCSCFVHTQEMAFVHHQSETIVLLKRQWSVAERPRRMWEPALEVILEGRLLLHTKDDEQRETAVKRKGKNKKKEKNGSVIGGLKPRFGVRPWRKE